MRVTREDRDECVLDGVNLTGIGCPNRNMYRYFLHDINQIIKMRGRKTMLCNGGSNTATKRVEVQTKRKDWEVGTTQKTYLQRVKTETTDKVGDRFHL